MAGDLVGVVVDGVEGVGLGLRALGPAAVFSGVVGSRRSGEPTGREFRRPPGAGVEEEEGEVPLSLGWMGLDVAIRGGADC